MAADYPLHPEGHVLHLTCGELMGLWQVIQETSRRNVKQAVRDETLLTDAAWQSRQEMLNRLMNVFGAET